MRKLEWEDPIIAVYFHCTDCGYKWVLGCEERDHGYKSYCYGCDETIVSGTPATMEQVQQLLETDDVY